MICLNDAIPANAYVSQSCGAVQKKKPTGLIWLGVILAAVIVVSTVLVFVLPSGGSDIASAAQNYVTAAYYADKVVNNATFYTSTANYKKDLKTAIDACRTLQNSRSARLAEADLSLFRTAYAADALEGLDTDADFDYSGGYTDGARESIDAIVSSMKRDAADALEALEYLDSAIGSDTNPSEITAAVLNAQKALSKADRTCVVVGSARVSFTGVTVLGAIHSAFIGADIVIDGNTLYLGANGTVMLSGSTIGNKVTVINSQSGSGVVMNAKSMANALDLGQMLAVTFGNPGETPVSEAFTDAQQFAGYVSDEISQSLGFDETIIAAASETPAADTSASTAAHASANGVYIDMPDIIGNWALSDAVFSPWSDIDTSDSVNQMQLDIEKQRLNTIFGDKEGVTHLIFRPDGTGIYYVDVEGATALPVQFWWRVDDTGTVLSAGGMMSYDCNDWDSYNIAVMQRFQNGDYSDIGDDFSPTMYKFCGADLYENADLGICRVYLKVSDSVDFTANPLDLSE